MAQSWRSGRGPAKPAPPLGPDALERLALRYVERFATTRAKLRAYLARKVRERGWDGGDPPAIEALAERMAELGYVDDGGFAISRAAGLTRRGFGPRRVAASLKAAGIADDDSAAARDAAREGAWDAAIALARRKRIGPFALVLPDRSGREKALAALLRAGHDMAMARRIVAAAPGVIPDRDDG